MSKTEQRGDLNAGLKIDICPQKPLPPYILQSMTVAICKSCASHRGKPTTLHHLYGPNSLKAMRMAFDAALDAFPHEGKREDGVRRELALLILHLADRGETDPTRLSRLALVTMVGRRIST